MFLNSATPLHTLWWIQLISYLLPSFISLLWDCNHPFAFFQSGFCFVLFVFCQEKNRARDNFCLEGEKSFTIFSFFLRFLSLFPLSHFSSWPFFLPFPVFYLKGGLAPPFSSTLLFLKIRMLTDCFFPLVVYLLAHTCFFHSGFLQVLARIFSCSAFCFSFLLCDYAGSPGPPSPLFRALSLGFASSCSAPTQDFAAWLSSRRCCGAAADTLFHSFFFWLFHFSQHSGIRFEC